ncbi:MAG: helix-turn-helix domain-containing protein [Bacteroidota bacterium]
MGHQSDKPIFALTVGEFTQLVKESVKEIIPVTPQEKPENQDEHLTMDQLTKFLSCSKVTVHNYKNLGLPYFRVGRKLLFKKSEVLDFMRKNVKRFFVPK